MYNVLAWLRFSPLEVNESLVGGITSVQHEFSFPTGNSGYKNIYTPVNGCFQKKGYPQIMNFNRVFHYKPSILGYPYFWKHPNILQVLLWRRNLHSWTNKTGGFKQWGLVNFAVKFSSKRFKAPGEPVAKLQSRLPNSCYVRILITYGLL